VPRVLKVSWDDLATFHEQPTQGIEALRLQLHILKSEPARFSLESFFQVAWAPYGPPFFKAMPVVVGHLLFALSEQVDEMQRRTVSIPFYGSLESWRQSWQAIYTDKKGKSTIPSVLGTPPVV
jgi:hypothetical protein